MMNQAPRHRRGCTDRQRIRPLFLRLARTSTRWQERAPAGGIAAKQRVRSGLRPAARVSASTERFVPVALPPAVRTNSITVRQCQNGGTAPDAALLQSLQSRFGSEASGGNHYWMNASAFRQYTLQIGVPAGQMVKVRTTTRRTRFD
jgi:hypothetical protein